MYMKYGDIVVYKNQIGTVVKNENDFKYYNNGAWVSKDNAEKFDWYNAENIARELKLDGINVIIESK